MQLKLARKSNDFMQICRSDTVLKIAKALGTSSGDLMYFTEALLPPDYLAADT